LKEVKKEPEPTMKKEKLELQAALARHPDDPKDARG
jgi:hypothetical protein